MKNQIDLSIIIVSWKVKDYLKNCLRSVNEHKGTLSLEIFVVDNNSSDGTAQMVKEEFSNVQLIANDFNVGFAKACNQALRKAQGEFILLLNPDTEILNEALVKMVDFMKQNPAVGLSSCKILNPDKTLQLSIRKFPNLISQILILLKIHNFFPRLKPIKNYYQLDFDYSHFQEVDQIMGAFFMIRKKVIDQIGFLDEKFWIWLEEVDFCKRVKEAGWKIVYNPQAEIIHHKAGSFSQISPIQAQDLFNRSLLYYFKKHHSLFAYLVLLIFYPVSIFLASLVQISGSFNINLKKKKYL